MALKFIGIDPGTGGDHCPAVFIDEETGDFLLQGWTATDPDTLTEVARHSPFIRFEHFITDATNIAAGEEVRWLPRRRASDLCLPTNDYWLFDDRLVRFHYFSGVGEIVEDELVSDPAVIRMCATAFEAVWERAIPHADYRPF